MRQLASATAPPPPPPPAAAVKLHPWKSPIPYLFGGLSLTMLLIAGALIILACSFRKRRPTSNSSDGGEKELPAAVDLVTEPKILVIMAGDDLPTFLATPAIAAADVPLCCSCSAKQQHHHQNSSPS